MMQIICELFRAGVSNIKSCMHWRFPRTGIRNSMKPPRSHPAEGTCDNKCHVCTLNPPNMGKLYGFVVWEVSQAAHAREFSRPVKEVGLIVAVTVWRRGLWFTLGGSGGIQWLKPLPSRRPKSPYADPKQKNSSITREAPLEERRRSFLNCMAAHSRTSKERGLKPV